MISCLMSVKHLTFQLTSNDLDARHVACVALLVVSWRLIIRLPFRILDAFLRGAHLAMKLGIDTGGIVAYLGRTCSQQGQEIDTFSSNAVPRPFEHIRTSER